MRAFLLILIGFASTGASAQWPAPWVGIEIPQHSAEPLHGARQSVIGARLSEFESVAGGAVAVGDPGSPSELGCDSIEDDVAGRIVVVRRGGCASLQKAQRAEVAGALAVVLADSVEAASPADTSLVWADGPSDSAAVGIPVLFTRAATAALIRSLGEPNITLTGTGTCFDYSGVVDPTPPWHYYPLAAGNVWEYINGGAPGVDHYRERIEVLRDTLVEGRNYFVLRDARYHHSIPGPATSVTTRLVRFDSAAARAVVRLQNGTEAYVTERLNAPVGSVYLDGWASWRVYRDGTARSHESCYEGIADGSFIVRRFVAGRGLEYNREYLPFGPFVVAHELTYSRIDGIPYGTPWAWPVDTGPPAGVGGQQLRVTPAPSTGTAAVSFKLPSESTATLQLFDALGRLVISQTLGPRPAGAGEVALVVSALAPGRYSVRLVQDGQQPLVAPLVIAR